MIVHLYFTQIKVSAYLEKSHERLRCARNCLVTCWQLLYTNNYLYCHLTLTLDSSRIQLDTLGHTPTPSVSVKSCHLCFTRWTPSFVGLCWPRPSSSLLVDLVLSCILVPASTVLAVVCACGTYGRHVQASEVVFLSVCCPWFVVQFWLWPPH